MATIFSKIISGEIPSYKVYEDDLYLAFLDIRPMAKGHTLLIPKEEVNYIFDIEDDLLSGFMPIAKRIAKAIEKVVPCKRVGVAVVGLEVPHAHIHLIPLQTVGDLRFDKTPIDLSKDEMSELAQSIREQL